MVFDPRLENSFLDTRISQRVADTQFGEHGMFPLFEVHNSLYYYYNGYQRRREKTLG